MAGELGRDWSLPLLPAGSPLFDGLPVGALVLDALAPAIGNGMITMSDRGGEGILVVRNGAVAERVWVANGVRSQGDNALALIRNADTAMVSARRLADDAMVLLGPLLHGDPCYADLRLEWVAWPQFLIDLCGRGQTFVVELSTKSELVDLTAGRRQTLGPVYIYDPTGEIGGDRVRTVTWSPIAGCDDLDRAWMVASWLCASLQQGGGRGDNDWSHWAESGKLLIAPLLYVAAVTGRTIVDVRTWIHGFDIATPITILEDMLLDPAAMGDSDPVRAMSMLASVDQRPERERGTVFSTVMRIFNVFTERAVAESALSSRFDPNDFLARKETLYLCTPRQTPERVASLFVGILMTVVTAAYAMSESAPTSRSNPVLGLFLDELANVVPIEDLPALASQGAGRGVMLMSIVQDLSQLRPVLHHFVNAGNRDRCGYQKLCGGQQRIGNACEDLLRERIIRCCGAQCGEPVDRCSDGNYQHGDAPQPSVCTSPLGAGG